MICIVMEEPLKDGEIHIKKCPTEKYVTIKAIFSMAMHIRNYLTYGGRFINWR